MSSAARKLIDEALALSEDERLEVAFELLASVDGPADETWQEAWLEELERRCRISDTGTPADVWPTVRDRIRRQLERQ